MSPTPGRTRSGAIDFECVLMSQLLRVMAAITFVQVAARFLFHAPLAHVSEFVPNLFVWLTFLGVSAAEKSGAHFGIDLVPKNHPRWARVAATARRVGSGIFFWIVPYHGARMSLLSYIRGETTPLGIPGWCFALAVPGGAMLFLLRLVGPLLRRDR